MPTTKKLLTLYEGFASDQSASFTVTTTGAQTLTINDLTVSASTTVDWGDGSSNSYTGSGSRTHNYAGAGTWTVRILEPLNVTVLDIRDAKFTGNIGVGISKLVNLTSLYLNTLSGVTWTVGASAPMPTGLTSLQLNTLSGVTIVSTLSACLALTAVQIENNLSDAAQSVILSELYAAFPTRTGTNGIIDLLGGGNAVSGGTLGPACPPTTTREYGYELVNDSCGVSAKHWASVSLQT